jgi:transposase IS4-like protein
VADSAMVSTGVAQQPADQREALRSAVIAGPAGFGVLDAWMTGRLWPVLAGPELIGQALAEAGRVDGRRRVLTGAVTAMIVLGLCLFRRESVAVVTARVTEAIPRVRVEGAPSGSAVSKARGRVPAAVWERLFVATAAGMPPVGAESYAFGPVSDRDRRHGVRPGRHHADAGRVHHPFERPVPAGPDGRLGDLR